MSRRSHFRVIGHLDGTHRVFSGTVTIDRASSTLTVRRARSRKPFVLPLSTVADLVVGLMIRQALKEKCAARKTRRVPRRAP